MTSTQPVERTSLNARLTPEDSVMAAAGAVPITSVAVLGEWQRDWAREESALGIANVLAEHGGGSGVAVAWEMQLLAGGGAPRLVDGE